MAVIDEAQSHTIDLNTGHYPGQGHLSTTVFCYRLCLIKSPSKQSTIMRLQTSLLSLILLVLILASYVDASAKNNKRKREDKDKKVSCICDNSTGRGDAVTLPTSPALKSKSKPKPASLLVDTTNSAPVVQLKSAGTLVSGSPRAHITIQAKKQRYGLLNVLRDREQYGEVCRPGINTRRDAILKHLFPVMATLDQFKGIYEYLKQRKMVPSFLAHGNMVLVKEVIVETDILETGLYGRCDTISDAIVLSFEEDRHDRAATLLKLCTKDPHGSACSTCFWMVFI